MARMKSKAMAFSKAIYEWLNGFAEAYNGVLPSGLNPENPYIRFDNYYDSFAEQFIFPISIYALNTTSYATPIRIADEIGDAIGEGGLLIHNDDITFVIYKGSPFYQNKGEEDETVRAGYVNLLISIY